MSETLRILKALADDTRLKILRALSERDMYVELLAERLQLSAATVSFHMKKLQAAGLVDSRREQYYIVYSLRNDVFNMTLNELLYGSFKEYVDMLITEKLGIELPEEFTRTFYSLLEQNGFTYGDDIEIVRLVNGFLTYHNLTTKETAIFYQPTAYSGDYFDGIIQKADSSVLVCRAYADKANNTLHIIPAFENGQTEEVADFFHALKSITAPHNNNYFTSGFLTLGLALRDSKVIIYGIDEKQGTAQVIPYEYDCESDAYIQNEHLAYTRQDSFFREATKEAVYRKMQSDRSNP